MIESLLPIVTVLTLAVVPGVFTAIVSAVVLRAAYRMARGVFRYVGSLFKGDGKEKRLFGSRSRVRSKDKSRERSRKNTGDKCRNQSGERMSGSRERVYSRARGWDASRLPSDMVADLSGEDKRTAMFTCAGIDNLVTGTFSKGHESYSFRLDDPDKVLILDDKINSGELDIKVSEDSERGGFVVTSSFASDINNAAKLVFIPMDAEAESVIEFTRQYVVTGCRSFAEAEAVAERMEREGVSPLNSFFMKSDRVAGEEKVKRSGSPVTDDITLPVGAFVVDRKFVHRFTANVRIPGNVNAGSRAEWVSGLAGVWSSGPDDTVVSDGTPSGARRSVTVGNKEIILPGLSRSASDIRLTVTCGDLESLLGTLGSGMLETGRDVVLTVGSSASHAPESGFAVDLPLTPAVLSCLDLPADIVEAVSACEVAGMSTSDAVSSVLSGVLDSGGVCSVRLREGLSLSSALVNGVPAGVVSDRLSSDRLPSLDGDALRDWLDDASRVTSVTLTVDPELGELRETHVIGGTRVTNTKPLTPEMMRDLKARGVISDAERRDLVISMYPTLFKSYSDGRVSRLADPVGDFIKGVKPALAPSAYRPVSHGLKPERRTPERKPGRGLSVS